MVEQSARGEPVLQSAQQISGELPFADRHRRRVPFRALRIVDGDESRLSAEGQPDIAGREVAIDLLAYLQDPLPLFFGVGSGHPRALVDPGDPHLVHELGFAGVDGPGNRSRRAGFGGAGQGDVTFAGQHPGGGVESDPSRSGKVNLAPSVQVGEIILRT